MILFELFDNSFPSLKQEIKNAVLDVLTPLASHGAKEVDILTIVDRLKALNLGLDITPDVIKDCVDPNTIPMVSSIDDDKIYLNGAMPQAAPDMDEPEAEPADPIGDSAKKQATASLKPKPLPKSPSPV